MANESDLMARRKRLMEELQRRGGKAKAPGMARELEQVETDLSKLRAGTPQTPTQGPPLTQASRADAKRKYQEAANRIKNLQPGTPEYDKNAQILQQIGSQYGWKWQDNVGNWKPSQGAQPPAGGGGDQTVGIPPGEMPRDPSAGNATLGVNTTFGQLLEGLKLGRELYPDGSLGRLPNPSPIGAISAYQKVGMIDVNDIPKVEGINMSDIPQVREISEAADAGQLKSIGQWEDYYTRAQQRDADIEAAKQRASLAAEKGYDDPTMQAKRAKANREVDMQTETALRDLRKSQGSAGNFGGVAAAQSAAMRRAGLTNKAMNETDLLAADADYRLKANEQAGGLAMNAFQTYNQAQQMGLAGLANARNSLADNVLRRQVSNQDAQRANQSGWLQGSDINLRARQSNASNWLNAKQSNQQAEGVNATNDLAWQKANKDIEIGNYDRERDTTTFNMQQSEKEKAGQMGTMFGWTQYGDAQEYQDRLLKLQEELTRLLEAGPRV